MPVISCRYEATDIAMQIPDFACKSGRYIYINTVSEISSVKTVSGYLIIYLFTFHPSF